MPREYHPTAVAEHSRGATEVNCRINPHPFLKDEESRSRERLLKRNGELGYSRNSPIADALYSIFESVGEPEVSAGEHRAEMIRIISGKMLTATVLEVV